jgi:hypothetical protein
MPWSTPGMSGRGSHRPAKNSRGMSVSRPMAFTLLAVGASAAISSPRAKSPAIDSRHESTSPPGLLGTGAPKAATLVTATMMRPASATPSWTTTCAAWLGHNAITEYLERADAAFVRLNLLLLLLVVSFLPFPTRLFASYIRQDSAERVAVTRRLSAGFLTGRLRRKAR